MACIQLPSIFNRSGSGPLAVRFGFTGFGSLAFTMFPSFRDEVERVRDVFTDSKSFDSLTKRLGNLTTEDWKDKQPREVILEAIDALIDF
jgi:hypothetical protein